MCGWCGGAERTGDLDRLLGPSSWQGCTCGGGGEMLGEAKNCCWWAGVGVGAAEELELEFCVGLLYWCGSEMCDAF